MEFSEHLINWYKKNKRDLPWRHTNDPYKIWLSEIILQQTKVDQGLPYYNAFVKKYPTIHDLAIAKEDKVLKLWQGLGYYSRARNLHFTAKHICSDLNGIFPNDFNNLLKLKGIGEYTAAAIASFSYNLPYPVIDGNVYRVLSRVFGLNIPIDSNKGKRQFKQLANQLIDKKQPAEYNQAIMEFGALKCKPKSPCCDDCFLNDMCIAFNLKKVNNYPVKEKKIKQTKRYFNYLVIIQNQKIILQKRKNQDIWKGLFEFPVIETKKNIDDFSELVVIADFNNININNVILLKKSNVYKHVLTHQKLFATFWMISCNIDKNSSHLFHNISLKKINEYPFPKLIENYIKSTL